MEKALFAAGCFWGVEATFAKLEGVISTIVGYSGGHTENPTYEDVCKDNTGHAECVLIEFDPNIITFDKLLSVFWNSHNPTTKNQQGNDLGSQYRSAIFYFNDSQKDIANKQINELNSSNTYNKPIVTEVTKATEFFKAEEYHQKYFEKNPHLHCSI